MTPRRPPSALRVLREARHLTQDELGRRIGVGKARVSDIERGRRWPEAWRQLCRLGDVLGVSADQILGREAPHNVLPELDARDRKLLAALEGAARDIYGPRFLQWIGGWRRVVEIAFEGALWRARDGQPPTGTITPPIPLAPVNDRVKAPAGWSKGWESPRQKARAANRPEARKLLAAKAKR